MRRTIRFWLFTAPAGTFLAATACSHSGGATSGPAVRKNEAPKRDTGALGGYLRSVAADFKGQSGHWTFRRDEVEITVVSDAAHDRMRVLAPVGDASKLAPADLATLLDADFDRALDAKYATRQGVVWALYVHPLSSLTKREFESAVAQVVALRKNFGTTFSSTNLIFAPPR